MVSVVYIITYWWTFALGVCWVMNLVFGIFKVNKFESRYFFIIHTTEFCFIAYCILVRALQFKNNTAYHVLWFFLSPEQFTSCYICDTACRMRIFIYGSKLIILPDAVLSHVIWKPLYTRDISEWKLRWREFVIDGIVGGISVPQNFPINGAFS